MPRTPATAKSAPPADVSWPADHVERRPITSLLAYPRNARTHSAAQVEQIIQSMQVNGWTVPILVDEAGVIIAGHGRLLAANKLGYKEVPVMIARGWTDEQKRSYRLSDNQLALNAGWDYPQLKLEMMALNEAGWEMERTGFAPQELQWFASAGEFADDPAQEWNGMPSFNQDQQGFRTLRVHFATQEDVDRFAKLVKQAIGADTKYIWFPRAERERFVGAMEYRTK